MDLPKSEVILEVGAEGGSVTLYGIRSNGRWIFSRNSTDQSAALLGEPLEVSASHTVDSWAGALAILDSYPWHKLLPLQVHPDFRGAVFDAVEARYGDAGNPSWNCIADWKAFCGVLDN